MVTLLELLHSQLCLIEDRGAWDLWQSCLVLTKYEYLPYVKGSFGEK